MARRKTPWKLIGGAFVLISAAAFAGVFWTGGAHPAPKDPGVCWRMHMEGDEPRFETLARDILNLESCAAHLERIHLTRGGEVAGAYQGRFIFIDDQAIRSASRLDGSRWRVFFDPQRENLDRRLRQGGNTPSIALMPAS